MRNAWVYEGLSQTLKPTLSPGRIYIHLFIEDFLENMSFLDEEVIFSVKPILSLPPVRLKSQRKPPSRGTRRVSERISL